MSKASTFLERAEGVGAVRRAAGQAGMGALGGCAERPNAGKAMAASLGSGAWHQAPTWMLTHHLQNHVPAVAQSKQRCQGAPTQPGLFSSFVGISWLLSTVSQKCDTHHLQRGRRFLQATGSIQA